MVRLSWILGVFLVLALAASVLWVGLELPPLRLLLAHGFPPTGGPTGRVKEIEGVRFVEIGTGCFRMGSWFDCTKGDSLGRVCKAFHLPWGKQPKEDGDEAPVRWVTIRQPYWIADCELTNLHYERFDPQHERSDSSKGDGDPVVGVSWEDRRPTAGGSRRGAGFRCGCRARRSGRTPVARVQRPNTSSATTRYGSESTHGSTRTPTAGRTR